MKISEKQTTAIVATYAVAMAMVETAAVIYLRELYYPAGFLIKAVADMKNIPANILRVELWREAATIVMLAAVGFLAFHEWRKRFWAFILAFSVWDLAYYLFLYVFIGWPPAFTTIDAYFLIPWPWIGPVWFPVVLFGVLAFLSLKKLFKI